MSTSLNNLCETCSNPLPSTGYFCGKCLTQFKCKACESNLEKDFAGCIMCGSPRLSSNTSLKGGMPASSNSFRVHETKDERTIEASFSDIVGKDIASILKDAATNRRVDAALEPSTQSQSENKDPITEDIEAQVINSENNHVGNGVSRKVDSGESNYPTLKAIAMRKLPSSEPEWVIVYAFYASNFGKDTFTRQQIVGNYKESGRFADYESKRLSTNIIRTVQSGYLNPLSDEFSILDSGIKKAIEIIHRTYSSTPRPKISGKKASLDENNETKSQSEKKPKSKAKGLKKLNNINFEPVGEESLFAFHKKYALKSDQERNLLFVYYFNQILKTEDVTFDHIYTCYDILDLKVSENLPQTVRNTASRTGWIEIKNSNILITIRGSNQIKEWNKQLVK